ncbi:MAG: hypothetical protein IT537_25805 [Hyphomicrobiales bacterium]|nr:hypothetical protein [Hyphomicrobiales bacterium]
MPDRHHLAERQALARRHVESGRKIVERQRELIAEIRSRGGDCRTAEDLLARFERTLSVFEDDLADLMKRTALPPPR